ncbi:isopentenyl-diphosphate delta-isomerase [Citreicella sp. SE45]|nr:isopentenyl-diphosphate delta-isomerase [Citreicella sp. SE45]
MNTSIPAWVDGVLTPVDKIEAHLRGLRHKAVSVFVLRGDEILLQRRALGKYHTPGLWANTCCTHPHWDEAPETCAARRLEEELGITGVALAPRGQVEYRADVGGGMIEHELVDIFVAEAPEGMTIAPNPDEVMDTDWVALDALRARTVSEAGSFTPWLRIYLSDHTEQILPGRG